MSVAADKLLSAGMADLVRWDNDGDGEGVTGVTPMYGSILVRDALADLWDVVDHLDCMIPLYHGWAGRVTGNGHALVVLGNVPNSMVFDTIIRGLVPRLECMRWRILAFSFIPADLDVCAGGIVATVAFLLVPRPEWSEGTWRVPKVEPDVNDLLDLLSGRGPRSVDFPHGHWFGLRLSGSRTCRWMRKRLESIRRVRTVVIDEDGVEALPKSWNNDLEDYVTLPYCAGFNPVRRRGMTGDLRTPGRWRNLVAWRNCAVCPGILGIGMPRELRCCNCLWLCLVKSLWDFRPNSLFVGPARIGWYQ